jgi:molybdenum cofactor cytidylyltransferase
MRTFALLPAAGHSTRMGQPKLALPLGNGNVLQATLQAVRQAGVEQSLVVLGPHVAELAASAQQAGAHTLQLESATPDMRATVEHGLAWIERHGSPAPQDAWLLIPADHPALNPAVIVALQQVLEAQPAASIAVPTHQGRRGHPVLIRWRHAAPMRAFSREHGLNVYLRQFPEETTEVAWPSDEVLLDLDTPEDYERLRVRFPETANDRATTQGDRGVR